MSKKNLEELEKEHIQYIKASCCCENTGGNFIFAREPIYSDYLDYSDQ